MHTKTVEIIDNLNKLRCPDRLGENQRTVYSVALKLEIIITKELADGRTFGGAFVKLSEKHDDPHLWVTSTLSERQLRAFVCEQYKVPQDILYKHD